MLTASLVAELRRLPLLAGLCRDAWAEVARSGVLRGFMTGQTLWTAGADPRGLFIVLSGEIRVVRAPAGRQHVVHCEGPGGTLGEVPLFAAGTYPATAIASADSRCVVLDRHAIGRVLARDPEFAFRLLERLALRVQELVRRLDARDSSTVAQRLARLILERQAAAGNASFRLAATQAAAAEEIGTVREVLVRSLRGLCAQGVVASTARGVYRVIDHRGLQRLAA